MLADAMDRKGVILISWQHEYIPEMAKIIMAKSKKAPRSWQRTSYDLVWVFDFDKQATRYNFTEVRQELLAGDTTS